MGAQRFCSFGSSFVDGYKWMRDYVAGKRDILVQISDRPAAAAPPGGTSIYHGEASAQAMQLSLTSRGDTPKSCQSSPASHVNLRCNSTEFSINTSETALDSPQGVVPTMCVNRQRESRARVSRATPQPAAAAGGCDGGT
jgi:hypothetical protein